MCACVCAAGHYTETAQNWLQFFISFIIKMKVCSKIHGNSKNSLIQSHFRLFILPFKREISAF